MDKETKVFDAEVKEFSEKDLTVTHFISTEKKDRGGDIMRVDGMKIRGRPVVLLAHGYSEMGQEPVAKPLSIKKGEFKGNKGIVAKTQFYPDEIGRRLWEKTTQGYMPNWSIGFIPLKKIVIPNKDPEGWAGRDITEWELLEYSPVGVPMNPDAQTPDKSAEMSWFKFIEGGDLTSEYKALDSFNVDDRSLGSDDDEEILEESAKIIGHKDLTAKGGAEASSVPPSKDGDKEIFEDVAYNEAGLVGVDEKPYPNEHACRINDPGKYDKIRRQNNKFGDGIHAIWGVKGDKTELQALRFDKSKFSADEAKKWANDHDYKCKPFEAASDKALCSVVKNYDGLLDKMESRFMGIFEKLIERLTANPGAAIKDQSQQNQNPPVREQIVVIVPEEIKERCTITITEKEKPQTVITCDVNVLREQIRETVKSTLRTEVNKLTGKID